VLKAVILCGGRGTRLAPMTDDRQKCMLPVAGRPTVQWAIESFRRNGVQDFVLVVGYRKEDVIEHFKDGSMFGVNIAYTVCERGTAEAVLSARPWVDENFLLSYGDLISSLNVKALLGSHLQGGESRVVTLTLKRATDVSRYGVIEMEDGVVTRFVEKPKPNEVFSNLINAGIMVCSRRVFDFIQVDSFSFEKQILPRLAAERRLYAVVMDDKDLWIDIGRPEDYEMAKNLLGNDEQVKTSFSNFERPGQEG